jgi:peptide deformylase
MAVKPIKTVPNKVLTTKADKVTEISDEIKVLVSDLMDTLNHAKEPEGAGIAMPQIGVGKRICIVKNFIANPSDESELLEQVFVLINPKITSRSKETELDWEGCLSIPDTYGLVERYKKIKIKALNETGEEIRLNASGYFARVIQHEIDHLDGVLFTSRTRGRTISEKEMDDLMGALEPSTA